jgi:BA14K-like protein
MRLIMLIGAMLILTSQARATVSEYCAAYARDFADQIQKQEPQWQHRYDNAEKACLSRFTSDVPPIAKVKQKAKPKQVTARKPSAPVVTPEPVAKAEAAPEQIAKAVPKLQPGSPEWTDYCKKKYVSFNETKGTYLSKTGIERRCLVTAE